MRWDHIPPRGREGSAEDSGLRSTAEATGYPPRPKPQEWSDDTRDKESGTKEGTDHSANVCRRAEPYQEAGLGKGFGRGGVTFLPDAAPVMEALARTRPILRHTGSFLA